MISKILAIDGSYREQGFTGQALSSAVSALREQGAETSIVSLRDYPIEFCTNCRECTQLPGVAPGRCVFNDGMRELIERIESSDGYILAAPTNLGSVTALYKRFMERMTPYAYWPWGRPGPVMRKAGAARKKALLISSGAAPALVGRWIFSSSRQLKTSARVIGATPVGVLYTGLAGQQPDQRLAPKTRLRAALLARRLLDGGKFANIPAGRV